ncbi:MAG: HlyD family efflux transporter periplasmic adaptor subunit [Bacteroidia bacterium]
MKKIRAIVIVASWSVLIMACNNIKNSFDASGSFEAEEIIISAEATGIIKELKIEEGQLLKVGDVIGYIDSTQLHLKKEQLEAQTNALLSKRPNVLIQLAALQEQLQTAEKEKKRIINLIKGDAATTKQLDDINANINVIKKQIIAQKSSLDISNTGINKEVTPLSIQVKQLNDQLNKCIIVNPINGTVLTKYAEQNEMALTGKAIYKIADLSTIILRVYISGNQLPNVKLNQKVSVFTDDGKGGFKETNGTISWINDKSEFTPKTIQTKEERANMVYAIKVKVVNDGSYKIGMYGEIKFQ